MKFAASIVLATCCPTEERYELCQQSFAELHNAGFLRSQYELIVVDNGGLHRGLIETLDPDLIITNSKNLGQAAGLNEGIAVARSPNLALIDDDLSFKEGWLCYGIKLLNQYNEFVISLREVKSRYITGSVDKHKAARSVGGVWIMRKSTYEQVGRFGVGYYDFGGLWTRNLLRQGKRFLVSEIPYIFHLGRGQSIVGKSYRQYAARQTA